MRTKRCVGYLLFLVLSLAVFFLLISGVFDDWQKSDDISVEENFRELIDTQNSLVMFYTGWVCRGYGIC